MFTTILDFFCLYLCSYSYTSIPLFLLHTLSFSLSLSLSHTHTYIYKYIVLFPITGWIFAHSGPIFRVNSFFYKYQSNYTYQILKIPLIPLEIETKKWRPLRWLTTDYFFYICTLNLSALFLFFFLFLCVNHLKWSIEARFFLLEHTWSLSVCL